MFSGAAYSKSTWGFETTGMSLAAWNKIEVAAANAAGFKAGTCRYSALCIAYGYSGHPFIRAIKSLFVLWFKIIIPLVNTGDAFLRDLHVAWNMARINIDTSPLPIEEGSIQIPYKEPTFANSLQKVNGILSQVSVVLVCLKCKPDSLLRWTDTAGGVVDSHP